jgi:hypothetical protein
MDNHTLRALSRRYAAGDIDRDVYRARRRALIEAIVNDTADLITYCAPEPDAPTVFPYDDDDGDTTQEIMRPIALPARVTPPRRANVCILLAVALSLTATVAWWLARPAAEEVLEPHPPNAERATAQAAFLESFLAANAWSPENLTEFENAWTALTDDQRAALLEADAMHRLSEGVIHEIATENALLELGDAAAALDSQRALLDFAARLGIDDPRLARAEQDWATAQRRYLPAAASDANTASDAQPAAPARR